VSVEQILDENKTELSSRFETATLAGGCFWCTEAVFKRIKGIKQVTSGYSGGEKNNPSYYQVTTGKTGHAEAIQLVFDPNIISFDHILDIFWEIHDPTTLNKQGNDVGTQYRSVIFYHNPEQKKAAEESKVLMDKSNKLKSKVVTKIEPYKNFYKAEDYHQDYYDTNKDNNMYCPIVITPKIQKLIEKFNGDVKEAYLV
jgi:peptide-methionine (S)-S-oxide reductase